MIVRRMAGGLVVAGVLGLSVVAAAAPAAAGGGVTVSVSAGELTIIGTALNDFIDVDRIMSGTTVAAYRVTDDRPVLAGPGCAAGKAPTEVRCSPIGVTSVYAWLDADEDVYLDATGLDADVYGGDANDVISIQGIGGICVLSGGSGDDRIFGGTADSTMFGGPGNDLIFGSFGQDYISGGDDDDRVQGSDSGDVLSGGNGFDIASYQDVSVNVTASLDGAVGNDGPAGEGDTILADVEGLVGGHGDDQLSGNAGPNWIFGGAALRATASRPRAASSRARYEAPSRWIEACRYEAWPGTVHSRCASSPRRPRSDSASRGLIRARTVVAQPAAA